MALADFQLVSTNSENALIHSGFITDRLGAAETRPLSQRPTSSDAQNSLDMVRRMRGMARGRPDPAAPPRAAARPARLHGRHGLLRCWHLLPQPEDVNCCVNNSAIRSNTSEGQHRPALKSDSELPERLDLERTGRLADL